MSKRPSPPADSAPDLFAWADQAVDNNEPARRSRPSGSGQSPPPDRRSGRRLPRSKTALAHVRLSQAERAEIEVAAAAFHVSLSDLIRAGALGLARQDAALLPQEARAVARASAALTESGRALARLSAQLHAGAPPPFDALIAAIDDLRAQVDAQAWADQALLAAHRNRAAQARRLLRQREDVQGAGS